MGTQSNIYEKNNKKCSELSRLSNNNEMVAKWFFDILEGIKNLKKNKEETTIQQFKDKIDYLFNLSNNMPKN
jgi:hypothetical protein